MNFVSPLLIEEIVSILTERKWQQKSKNMLYKVMHGKVHHLILGWDLPYAILTARWNSPSMIAVKVIGPFPPEPIPDLVLQQVIEDFHHANFNFFRKEEYSEEEAPVLVFTRAYVIV